MTANTPKQSPPPMPPPTPIDEIREQDYWKNQYDKEGYYEAGKTYDEYDPAYRTGYQGRQRYPGKTYDEAEGELKKDYERASGETRLGWEKAKQAIKAAWHRIEDVLPGDADRDGH
ncbi:MAG TPA: hypothetical protein VLZ76_00290 [Lysobacter sp.]|jgi:hypothetical protein|uniref:hypothetical protein n=1 Tax=Lysobacteraceae TaxID=32033 RepID=UPI000691AAF9|nr:MULTISPECIES: hypothetical protein [Lysobacter]QOD91087.1 hypothetical protein H2514_13185 [Lysobacter sp. CW239]HUH89088.1 hypothetical protein [Lysobacter sp.]